MNRMNAFVITICLMSVNPVYTQDAKDIVRRANERVRGTTSQSSMIIQIIRPSWSREMSMKTWSKGTELAMILITSPAKDKGTIFLKRKREVWNWIPSIERNIKLPPSMMSQSWMGTDFTNDDLVKEASVVEDYNHSIIGEEEVNARMCYKLQMIPKPESAVVWGKVILWVDKKDLLMMKSEYYDEENRLVNTMLAGDVKMLGGRWLPARLEMIPAGKAGNKTVLIYNTISFDNPLEDTFFSIQNMQKVQ